MADVADQVRSIEEEQHELVDEFAFFDDWMDRYRYIIDLGRKLPEFPEALRTEENRIRGCQSQVWMVSERKGDRLFFEAISDSAIVSGLIAMLLRIYSGRLPREILETEPRFIREIGLTEHLSPTRSNGLHAMLQSIYERARAAA